MEDEGKTAEQLRSELSSLRRRVSELEDQAVERKLVEEALRESEEQFRTTFDNLREGLLLADQETKKFLMGNPAILEMLGYTAEELNRMEVADIHPEQDLLWVLNQFEELAKGKIELAPDIPVRRKDGSVFYADISSSFPMVFNGKKCVMRVFRDVTERRQARDSLEESETKFRTLVERRPDAMTFLLALDENLTVLYISPQAEKIFGWPAQEHLQDPGFWLKCVHPDDYERVYSQAERLQKEGQPFSSEYRIIRKDGRVVWLHDVSDLMRDQNGRPISILGVAIDITARKREEEQTSKLNSLKERLLEANSLDQKLKSITDGIVEIFGADFARIWITREGDLCEKGCLHATATEGPNFCRDRTRCLHLVASSGRYTGTEGSHGRVPLGCYKIGRVAFGEYPSFITNNVTRDPNVHGREWAKDLGLVAFAGFRLLSADHQPVGVLALFRKEPIQPAEGKLLQNLADATSLVILAGMAEEALRQSEARFHALFDHSPIGISIARQGVTLLFNEAGLRIFGYDDCSEVTGTSQLNRIAPQCRDELSEYIKRRERGEAVPGDYETQGIRRDGSIFHLYLQAAGMELADGPATVSFFADITRRKVAEVELGRYRSHLEELVKERTSELDRNNQQLTCEIEERKRLEFLLRLQRDVALTLGSAGSMDEALERLLQSTMQIEGIDAGGVYLVDAPHEEVRLVSHAGLSSWFVDQVSFYGPETPQMRLVMQGEPVYYPDVRDVLDVGTLLEREQITALAVIPIKSKEQVVAVLNLASRNRREVPESTRQALEAIAAGIGGIVSRVCAEEDLRMERENLAEANTALKVLLRQREEDRRDLEAFLLANVANRVMPYVGKLMKTRLTPDQAVFLEIIDSNLQDITSPFLRTLSRQFSELTPMESRVASLIREGRTSKETAQILGISQYAVLFHRRNVREKLGLKGKKINLESHLSRLS